MVTHNPARVGLMFVGLFAFLVSITLNSLSGFGAKSGVFQQSIEDVTLKYTTPITPAHWAMFVWDFMYIWIFGMFLYFLVGLCRRSAYDWMYTTPAVLPYGFHVSIIINICLNITWLFLFDRELLLPVLVISALMMLTDYMILFFSCHGLKIYGAWLHKYHNTDFWLMKILVQNGVAVYATWGTLSTLLNLTMYMQHETETSSCDCAMLSLVLLLMELLPWFLLENFYFDEHVRYIVTIYPVVILWLTGTLSNSDSPESHIYIFAALILAISCVMFVARIALVVWKHHKRPLYSDSRPSMSPSSELQPDIMSRFQMSTLSVTNDHGVIRAGSVAMAAVSQVISTIFWNLAKDSNVPNALFRTSSRNVTETFPLEVTMDWWSDSYWIMIDLWSKAWLLYATVSLFKRDVRDPEIHPSMFYLMWTTINIARMCSMPLWDRQDILAAVTLRWVLPVLSFYMLYVSYSNLDKHKAWLALNKPHVILWTRYLTQNGLAVFAWWSLLNSLVDLGMVLKYNAGVPDPLISTIVLTAVFLCTIIWFILQSCLFTKYLRYTFSVYAILVLGLGAMFTRSYRFHDLTANTIYCGFLMLLMTILSLSHLISACVHTGASSKPVATAPYLPFEGCETVWHIDLRSDDGDTRKDFCKI